MTPCVRVGPSERWSSAWPETPPPGLARPVQSWSVCKRLCHDPTTPRRPSHGVDSLTPTARTARVHAGIFSRTAESAVLGATPHPATHVAQVSRGPAPRGHGSRRVWVQRVPRTSPSRGGLPPTRSARSAQASPRGPRRLRRPRRRRRLLVHPRRRGDGERHLSARPPTGTPSRLPPRRPHAPRAPARGLSHRRFEPPRPPPPCPLRVSPGAGEEVSAAGSSRMTKSTRRCRVPR